MKIIIINGHAETGKDKFVDFFKDITKDKLRVKNYSSVDKVKQIANICFGWNGKKNDKSRRFLSEMKRIWTEFNDGPFNEIKNRIYIDYKWSKEKNKDVSKNIYFIHVREPKEIMKLKDYYGDDCITLIVRKDIVDIPNNDSDKDVEKFDYDYIVDNNSSEKKLRKKVKKFYKYLQQSL